MANEFKVKHGLIVNGSGSTVLDVQGSQGQLFSITDSLSGSLFSVGDISGIPILEVFSDDTVKVGSYGSEAIIVSGSHATVSGSFSGSFQGDGSGLTGITSAEDATITLTAGTNLSGGGSFTTNQSSADTITFNLDLSGTNIISGSAQLPSGTVSGSSQIDHDQTTNFVANEHIDHSSVSITAGTGLSGGGDLTTSRTLNLDFSELTDMTGDISGTTEFILQNGSTESRKAASEIKLSNFNNDSGWTSNTGDITRVNITAGGGLTGNQDTTTGDHTQTIAVGAGTGVTVNADNVAIGQDVATTANVTFATASISQNLTVGGDLIVLGDAVEIQVGELSIEDKNILIASGAADSAAADGAGLTIGGANESITWDHSNSRFNISDDVNVVGNITLTGTVDGVDVAALETTVNNLDTSVPAIVDNSGTPAFNTGITKAEVLSILNVEDGATADQTDAQIETAYNNQVSQVSSGEITAGTETGIRRFSVADIKSMIDTHETDNDTTYSAGTGIALSGTTFNLDFSELTDKTTDIAGTTEFILQDGSTESRKAASEIKLSNFNNDLTTFTSAVTIESATDGILNLKQTDAGSTAGTKEAGWNYIQFLDGQGDRQGYFGIDSGGDFLFNPEITGAEIQMNRLLRVSSDIVSTGTITVGTDLTVSGGDITLSGTGRIQGVDTVSAATDAANKSYVDTAVSGLGSGTVTEVTVGTGLDVATGTTTPAITLDLSELTDMTAAVDGTLDELILLDSGAERRKLVSEINLGQFNNDQGWTSNTGDITEVAAGTGLSGGGTSGAVTLNLDFSELTDKITDIAGTTEFIIQDGTTESRKAASEIKLSNFNNDSGWTSNTGDVTGVTLAADTGTASDSSGNVDLTIEGGTNITTSATGTTLTINNGITNNNQLTNGAGYITSFDITTQTDPKYLRSDANDDFSGTLNFTPDTGNILSVDGQTILKRNTSNGSLTFGHDDMVVIAGGDTNGVINSNLNTATELVVLSSEGGFHAYAFPNNDTTWSNRERMTFDGVNGLNVENLPITGSDVKIDNWGSVSASLASINSNMSNADTLDNLDSTQFLRSDQSDTATGVYTFTNTTNSTSLVTGTVIVNGGTAVKKNLNVGENLTVFGESLFKSEDGGGKFSISGSLASSMSIDVSPDMMTFDAPANSGFTFNQGSSAFIVDMDNAAPTFNGYTMWHSNNDGAGSGLNADLLDGSHASAFLRVSNNLSDLNNAGTARGNLGLNFLTTASISSPGSDRILFYDNSTGDLNWLQAGSGINISGTTITATDTNTMGNGFKLEDGDGTEVTITEDKYVRFVEGSGIEINWTDTSDGSQTDEYDLTFTIDPSDFMSNGANNRILTAVDADNMNAEANLLFNGSKLEVTGSADINGALFLRDDDYINRYNDTDTKFGFDNADNFSVFTNGNKVVNVGATSIGLFTGIGADTGTFTLNGGSISDASSVTVDDYFGFGSGYNIERTGTAIDFNIAATRRFRINSSGVEVTGSLSLQDLTVPGNLTLSGLIAQGSEGTALMINGSNVVGTRELGSNAFTSNAIPTSYFSAVQVGAVVAGAEAGDTLEFIAGDNITLSLNNTNTEELTISATTASYTPGTGLDITAANQINLDLSEFTDMTANVNGAQDELILLDNGAERRKLINEINLGQFNNDQGWTNNTGTVNTSGTPVDNQLAVFTDSDTIEGTSGLTYNGSAFGLSGYITGSFYNGVVALGTNVDFASGQVFTKTLTGNTTLTFNNYKVGQVKDLRITGDYSLSFPSGVNLIGGGTYDGTAVNFIQVICIDQTTPEFWMSISRV